MSPCAKLARALLLLLPLLCARDAPAADLSSATVADLQRNRMALVAAMQRIRLNQPDEPDSPALEAYSIHDYLVAARFRRDLIRKPDEALDASIDEFLLRHTGQPVARALKHDWLVSLAQRHRWDWFLPRSVDATDPQLVCQRFEGRLAVSDTQGLAALALARWRPCV